MVAGKSNHEVEIRLRVSNTTQARRALRRAGFRVRRRRVFESNVLFDTPEAALRRGGSLLRLRQAGREVLLTYKGPSEPGKHKMREELELELQEASVIEEILRRLGLEPAFRYEKYRTEYQRPGAPGIVTLDETPIGNFMELEGTPAWIDSTAGELGYRESDYITASYGRLYLEFAASRPDAPPEMVFGTEQGR